MQRVLSLDETPPLSAPLRFFLTAPLFAVAAGLLLAWHGSALLTSRWAPLTLAATHLLTLGFLAMCMLGALLQMLPVVVGVAIPRARTTASGAHALLASGTAALAAAFALSLPLLFRIALPLLLGAFAWLAGAGLRGVWCKAQASPMLTSIRLSLLALAVTLALGGTAASGFGWQLALPLLRLAELHAAWGLLGWVALLIVGVAYQVVPMFQVTPVYPRWMTRLLAGAMFAMLAAWTVAASELLPAARWALIPAALLAILLAAFTATTLHLLSRRKRPKPDVTTLFWVAGLASLCACVALWLAAALAPGLATTQAWQLALGILFIVGFACSVVCGMLYKIVPFLVWYHLQNRLAGGAGKAPSVKQIIPDPPAMRHFALHVLALTLLLGATLRPEALARLAGAAFAISATVLGWNLLRAARVYRSLAPK